MVVSCWSMRGVQCFQTVRVFRLLRGEREIIGFGLLVKSGLACLQSLKHVRVEESDEASNMVMIGVGFDDRGV